MADRIYQALNINNECRAAALDIMKSFERVRYTDVLHKLKRCVMSGQIFEFFLSHRE